MLEWLAELSEEDRLSACRRAFVEVAQSESGKIVFAAILNDLCFFRQAEMPEEQALNNYAKFLINHYFGEDAKYRVLEALLGRGQ